MKHITHSPQRFNCLSLLQAMCLIPLRIDDYPSQKLYLINFKYEISLAPAFAFRDSK